MTSSADPVAKPMIETARWQSVGPLDVDALAKARSEAINLAQWLARIANSFVTADTADERIALEFRPTDAAFVTKKFARDLSLELRLPRLEMQFREGGRAVPHIFDPEERSPAEAEAWLLVELLHRGLDRVKFSKKLPYKIPGLMTGDAEDHSPQSHLPALTQIMAWFRNAAAALDEVARATGTGAANAGTICRPQTLSLSSILNAGSAQIDIGFTPGDARIPEPYFYRSLPTAKGAATGKTNSVLTASALLAKGEPAAAAIAFLKGSPN